MKAMDSEKETRLLVLIAEVLEGDLGESDREELNALLGEDPAARKLFRKHLEIHARLHLDYSEGGILPAIPPLSEHSGAHSNRDSRDHTTWLSRWIPTLAAAALVVFAFVFWSADKTKPSIATLLSSENAAWESLLPTTPGARLSSGALDLKAGVATIRFLSGAEVTLEAPARIELIDSMKGRLLRGSAVIDVPEEAIGFVMETPNSYAIDHGTSFAMSVDEAGERSTFEVLSGEISVHHAKSGESQHLFSDESTSVSEDGVMAISDPFSERVVLESTRPLRITTEGRGKSIIRGGNPNYLDPDFLMVKSGLPGDHNSDRRCFFAFDLSGIEVDQISTATLRLNLVPTGRGLAAQLPKRIRFVLYGLPDSPNFDWESAWKWNEAPTPEMGRLLGGVEISRSQQSGIVAWEGTELLEFLSQHEEGMATFLVVRETQAPANGSLVHGFASDSHPSAAGPVIELKTAP